MNPLNSFESRLFFNYLYREQRVLSYVVMTPILALYACIFHLGYIFYKNLHSTETITALIVATSFVLLLIVVTAKFKVITVTLAFYFIKFNDEDILIALNNEERKIKKDSNDSNEKIITDSKEFFQ